MRLCFRPRFPSASTARQARLALLAASFLAAGSVAAPAAGQSADDYRFVQLTDDGQNDRLARVSSGSPPLVVWMSKSAALPGAQSGGSDFEILLWDGRTLKQLTDDAQGDYRPVVNTHGEVAWMKPDIGARSEIYVRYRDAEGDLVHRRVTHDGQNATRDRYPDINDNGLVAWGRRGSPTLFAVYALGDPDYLFDPSITGAYRPHINELGHIAPSNGEWIRDATGDLISTFDPTSLGYDLFYRTEINDHDQLIIEAAKHDSLPQTDGARDILFWDGSEMHVVFESDVYAGRGDLNNDGVAAFEGLGGLASSTSDGADHEIFVYLHQEGEVFQLTDNDVDDRWPTVTDDGTIVWESDGLWVGAPRGQFTGTVEPHGSSDIMVALPLNEDFDADGVPNDVDNCAVTQNANQADDDGDGIGNRCKGVCDGFTHLRSCEQAVVEVGKAIPVPEPHCGGGAGGTAAALTPLVLMRAWRSRRARHSEEPARLR